jgi:heterotetrameric sarcosine oxidase delta subunit
LLSPAPSAAPRRRDGFPLRRPGACAPPATTDPVNITDEEQRDYLFIRHNPKGLHFERWRCDRGCGKWFHAARDTVTLEFKAFYGITELPPRRIAAAGQGSVGRLFQIALRRQSPSMTGKPYRLASGGNRIDRSKPLSFSFDGKHVPGFAGDTVASAVLASGQRVFGRSFKYHRPRGVIGLGSEEMNALIGVGVGARHEPNLRATQIELFNGMTAVSQNRWPSLNFDIGAINNKLSRFFPGGFYYKTFMWPRRLLEARLRAGHPPRRRPRQGAGRPRPRYL